MSREIRYDRQGFILNGRRVFLLNGTIPYYRLHPDDWAVHLDLLKASGYTGVDVYVPWNYHEREPGVFDFHTGHRDLGAFLDAIHARGLYAYFRPGPYICNEWDGGGLPAWLLAEDGLRIRENEPRYLAFATRYMTEVARIAAGRQYTRGGPVILFALENEYDFYPARTDRHAYLSALRDTVRAAGIDVPLVACIGGGAAVRSATGLVEGVIPTPNFYLNGAIEEKTEDCRRHVLAQRFRDGASMADLPVFVTEMGRREQDQLRILAGGVKGLGPFNFSGGSHAGFWNGLTNWGGVTPIASVVDFGGMVGFDGCVRPEFWGARRATGFIHAFEPELLAADSAHSRIVDAPAVDNPRLGTPHFGGPDRRVYSLVAGDTGFVFLMNETEHEQALRVTPYQRPAFPRRTRLALAPGALRIAAYGVKLARWALPGDLLHLTGQVVAFDAPAAPGEPARLAFHAAHGETAEMLLSGDWAGADASASTSHAREADGTLFTFTVADDGAPRETTLEAADGARLCVAWMGPDAAARRNLPEQPGAYRRRGPAEIGFDENWTRRAYPSAAAWAGAPVAERPDDTWEKPLSLERRGIPRGAVWYRGEATLEKNHPAGTALTLARALDWVSVYWDGQPVGARWGTGEALSFALPGPVAAGAHRLDVRVEIWGHAGFHDENHYATRLDAERGLLGEIRIGDEAPRGRFALCPESVDRPANDPAAPAATTAVRVDADWTVPAGGAAVFAKTLDADYPMGAVLELDADGLHGEIWLENWMTGRFIMGLLTPRDRDGKVFLTGGPSNLFFLPGALARKGAALALTARAADMPGRMRRVMLYPIRPLAD